MVNHRGAAAACLSLALVATLAACSPGGRSAKDGAQAMAAALSAGDVSSVSGAAAQQQLQTILKGMDGLRPTATVADTSTSGDTGTAHLQVSWPLAGQPWSYTTTAKLARSGNDWAAAWAPTVLQPKLGTGDRLVYQRTWAPRADITGNGDEPLMTHRPVQRIGLNKPSLPAAGWDASAARLAAALDIDTAAYRAKVAAAGKAAFVEALVVRGDPDQVDPDVQKIPGVQVIPDTAVLGPTKTFAAGLLGTVGPATQEQVAASKGTLVDGDVIGQTGLEARYDAQLRGTPGDRVLLRGSHGDTVLTSREPVPGTPLRTTLRRDAQTLAEQLLSSTKPASALVAIDPATSQVIAAATGAGNPATADATTGRYAPGSTFKTVTALALLRSGMTPDTEVNCTSTVTVDGRRFKNYNDFPSDRVGRMPLREAIALSCNTALIAEHDRINAAALQQAAASLGLGQDFDAGYPVFLGSVPEPKNLPVGLAEAMIGQGTVEASPLAMATITASIQAGHTIRPILLPDHHTTAPQAPPLTATEAAQLRDMLHAVVTDGSGRFLTGLVDGAKTGTAEYGTDTPPRTHAWMIAYDREAAVAVMVADGNSGSGTAGPILKGFFQ